MPKRNSLVDPLLAVGVIGNILSVVGVVLCNKYIITHGFTYTMVLSASHFAFTSLGCHLMLRMGVFTYKRGAWKHVLPVALGSLSSVAFMNLNLAYNSVGFYQLSKLMCIPFTIFVQHVFFRQEASLAVKLTLIPILLGVGLATVEEVAVNWFGFVFAFLAVVFTTFSQFFTQRYQAVLQCNAMQLLHLTSPLIAVGMLVLAPFFDDLGALRTFLSGTTEEEEGNSSKAALLGWVLLSCVLALGVNMSNYLVLGKSSPLTYQVLGHLKTVLILVLGVVLIHTPVNARLAAGASFALCGVIAYTEVKRRQGPQSVKGVRGTGLGGGKASAAGRIYQQLSASPQQILPR